MFLLLALFSGLFVGWGDPLVRAMGYYKRYLAIGCEQGAVTFAESISTAHHDDTARGWSRAYLIDCHVPTGWAKPQSQIHGYQCCSARARNQGSSVLVLPRKAPTQKQQRCIV